MPSKSPHPAPESTQAIVLEHTLPDGSSHYDWMIEIPASRDEHRLLTFRCDIRPDLVAEGQLFLGEQLPNHRAHYLEFQGDIGGRRGAVTRLARGICIGMDLGGVGGGADDADRCCWIICWESGGGGVRYSGEIVGGQEWSFGCSRIGLA